MMNPNNFFQQYPRYSNPFSSEESLMREPVKRDVSPPVRQRGSYQAPVKTPTNNFTSQDLIHMSVEEIL
jgi:hypothetical protein